MKAWTLNSPTQSPGDLQHSWEQTKDVGVADALTDNVQQKDKDEEDKEDVDTEEASSLCHVVPGAQRLQGQDEVAGSSPKIV